MYRRRVKLVLPLAAVVAVAAVLRSRRDVEVWHVAPDVPPGDAPGLAPGTEEGP